ncbi:hypothetical protein PRUPE_8G072800 [Prunus persica]|uniref:TF-B3 domain-containing protein n=1 Tax=Prunus persica TaxID=3760 RepID=A0A251MUI8_PRUPE|nr:hypothetical protein PRUPE_8G072800 [Prunus persica]
MAAFPHQKIDLQGPKFRATTPHFFKMIADEISGNKRLRVPKTFLDKCGEHLSDQIHLKLPCGSEWKIKLRRCNGEVWLGKGWPEFSEFYSLKKGNSLLFRYEGNSKFNVLIFDESGTEMDYPITITLIEETDEEVSLLKVWSIFQPSQKRSTKLILCYLLCLKRKAEQILILHQGRHLHLHLKGFMLKLPMSSSQATHSSKSLCGNTLG